MQAHAFPNPGAVSRTMEEVAPPSAGAVSGTVDAEAASRAAEGPPPPSNVGYPTVVLGGKARRRSVPELEHAPKERLGAQSDKPSKPIVLTVAWIEETMWTGAVNAIGCNIIV